MARAVILFFSLIFFWWVLSGLLTPFFIVVAFISVIATLFLADKLLLVDDSKPLYIKPNLIIYVFWLLYEIIKAGISVTIRIWQFKPAIRPTLSWISSSQRNDVYLSLYANSITLTSGTICVDTDGKNLQIHSLYLDTIEDLKAGGMNYKVAEV